MHRIYINLGKEIPQKQESQTKKEIADSILSSLLRVSLWNRTHYSRPLSYQMGEIVLESSIIVIIIP